MPVYFLQSASTLDLNQILGSFKDQTVSQPNTFTGKIINKWFEIAYCYEHKIFFITAFIGQL